MECVDDVLMHESKWRLVAWATLPLLLGGCLGKAASRGGESRLSPRVPTAQGAASASLLGQVSPRVASPTPLILGPSGPASSAPASSPSPQGGSASPEAGSPESSAPSGTTPAASATQGASQPQAEPTATPFVRLLASPESLRAFPIRAADGQMYDCRFDPALGVAQWRVSPSAGSQPWGRFKLQVSVQGEVAATAPYRLGPGALSLGDRLDGPVTLSLPLAIPPVAEQVAAATSGSRVLVRLEAEASGGGPMLDEAGRPLRLEASLEVL